MVNRAEVFFRSLPRLATTFFSSRERFCPEGFHVGIGCDHMSVLTNGNPSSLNVPAEYGLALKFFCRRLLAFCATKMEVPLSRIAHKGSRRRSSKSGGGAGKENEVGKTG